MSQTVLQGNTAVFSVAANGATPLAYQWFFNSAPIPLASNSTAMSLSLVVSSAQGKDVGEYFAVVTNQFGRATSAVVTLTVTNSSGQPLGPTNPPVITQQPANVIANEGTNVSFSVIATGAPPITYQWYFSSNAISAAVNPTAIQSTFTLTNVQGSNAGFYQAVASNAFGMATSIFASLTVTNTNGVIFLPGNTNGIPLSNSPPIITQQPTNQTVRTNATNSVTFTVLAQGASPLSYFWRFNSNVIDGATNATAASNTLVVSNLVLVVTNFYDVIVSNEFGSVTSAVARLVVTTNAAGGGPPCPIPGGCDEYYTPEVRLGTVMITEKGVIVPVSGARPGRKLVLEYKDRLSDPEWISLGTNDAAEVLFDPTPPIDRSRYYRVRAE
jgi:hypothetical protein